MVYKKNIARTVIVLIIISFSFFSSINLTTKANQAIVPISITVHGKLVLTSAENDNISGKDPTLNVRLNLSPDLNNQTVSGNSAIRIRTNLNTWKLTAQRINSASQPINIDPKDISLSFTTQSGAKANPNAGKLLAPFNTTTDLNQISSNSPTEVLLGLSKTSLGRDPENKNNWFQLTTNYSILPDFFYEIGQWDTTITYNLVSP